VDRKKGEGGDKQDKSKTVKAISTAKNATKIKGKKKLVGALKKPTTEGEKRDHARAKIHGSMGHRRGKLCKLAEPEGILWE